MLTQKLFNRLRECVGPARSANRLFIITALFYVYFFGGYINNSMTNCISFLTVALVEDQSANVEPYMFDKRDIAEYQGRYYSGMPPGTSFLLVPVYGLVKAALFFVPDGVETKLNSFVKEKLNKKYPDIRESKQRTAILLLHFFAVLFVSIPLAIGMGYAFFKILPWVGIQDRTFSIILCAFLLLGTNVSDFSATFFHNTVAACIGWLVFVKIIRNGEGAYNAKVVFCLGLLLGTIPTIDFPALAYAGVLYLSMILNFKKSDRLRHTIALTFGFSVPIALLLLYQWSAFGSPWTTSYQLRTWERVDVYFESVNGSRIWSFLPTYKKLKRAFLDSSVSVLIYNPFLVIGLFLSAFAFFKAFRNKLQRQMWGTAFLWMFANFCFYLSLPLRVSPAWGSYGARYTVYSVPFALLVCAPFLYSVYQKIGNRFFAFILCVFSIPAWLFLFYGSPNQTIGTYLDFFLKMGPSNYTLTKAYDAGLINSPFYSYAGILVLFSIAYWIWKQPFLRARNGP